MFLAGIRMWNYLPYTVLDTGTLDGFKRATFGSFPELCFFHFSVAHVHVGLRKQFVNYFVFPTFVFVSGFNNHNKNNNNKKKKI